jgi:hypothetical protein
LDLKLFDIEAYSVNAGLLAVIPAVRQRSRTLASVGNRAPSAWTTKRAGNARERGDL